MKTVWNYNWLPILKGFLVSKLLVKKYLCRKCNLLLMLLFMIFKIFFCSDFILFFQHFIKLQTDLTQYILETQEYLSYVVLNKILGNIKLVITIYYI